MSYKDHLQRYGSAADTGEIRFNIFIQDPAKLNTAKEIAWRDKYIAADIAELERIAADLKEYRQDLARRYSELETMLYSDVLKLERCPYLQGHIEYIVTITRNFEDGSSREELREVFKGKDRKAAFDRFAELQRARPGIQAEKDIEKRQWEKR